MYGNASNRFLTDTGLTPRVASVVPLTGDASDRRYFRILLRGEPSLVLAVHPGAIDFARLPFVNVASLLAAMALPAPRIIAHCGCAGHHRAGGSRRCHVAGASRCGVAGRACRAVSRSRRADGVAADAAGPSTFADYVPYGIAFDEEKLTWELQFFMQALSRGVPRRDADRRCSRRLSSRELTALARELAAEPRVLCHRDYHSRNLMLHDGRLHMIDFQDARMGPDTYDLASLLRDSYVDFTEAQVDELLAYFLALRGARAAAPSADAEAREFRRRFDTMALQRNIKALGTFGFRRPAAATPCTSSTSRGH